MFDIISEAPPPAHFRTTIPSRCIRNSMIRNAPWLQFALFNIRSTPNKLQLPCLLWMIRQQKLYQFHILPSKIRMHLQVIPPPDHACHAVVKFAHGQVLTNAIARSSAKGHKALFSGVNGVHIWIGPTCGIELVWVREDLSVVMHRPGTHANYCAGWKYIPVERGARRRNDTG